LADATSDIAAVRAYLGLPERPRAHGQHYAEEAAEVLEMLAFASLLMRRLDLVEQRQRAAQQEAVQSLKFAYPPTPTALR
jgi:3-deoxy-D-manno-octulosonic acid (KDO) 8-phosphate synthase